jgi:prepilin-type N-terminal cleavage/methylation domain-containing protein/prepilin-type processing-associated H-X9-DG protein
LVKGAGQQEASRKHSVLLPDRRTGFTVLELLIVMAVIAIIAGITFPVLSRMKEKGRQSTCVSNIRQLWMASAMYAQEYGGVFPPYMNSTDPGFNKGIHGYPRPDLLHSVLMPYVGQGRVWYCPSDPYAGQVLEFADTFHQYSSYYYNFLKNGDLSLDGIFIFIPHQKRVLVGSASDSPAIYDSMLPTPSKLEAYGPHFGGCNRVFVDGHVTFWK